jgi:DNA-binding GntR family transcriptional regulator
MAGPRDTTERAPTAHARAVSGLRAAILEGRLLPGQRVNQEDWAERVGVSLIPIREALGTLSGEGLVTYRPRRGYAVTELDLGALEEIYRIRRLLETDALERGVPHATDADVEALRAAARDCRTAALHSDVVEQLAANRRFHDVLHGLAGSHALVRLIDQLWDTTEAYRALYYTLPGEAVEAHAAHDSLVEAVAARDGAAAVAAQDAHRERALAALRIAFSRQASAA